MFSLRSNGLAGATPLHPPPPLPAVGGLGGGGKRSAAAFLPPPRGRGAGLCQIGTHRRPARGAGKASGERIDAHIPPPLAPPPRKRSAARRVD